VSGERISLSTDQAGRNGSAVGDDSQQMADGFTGVQKQRNDWKLPNALGLILEPKLSEPSWA